MSRAYDCKQRPTKRKNDTCSGTCQMRAKYDKQPESKTTVSQNC